MTDSSSGKSGRLRATMSLAGMNVDSEGGFGIKGRTRKDSLATPEEFVNKFGGTREIKKVLIANNGIAGKEIKLMPLCFSL